MNHMSRKKSNFDFVVSLFFMICVFGTLWFVAVGLVVKHEVEIDSRQFSLARKMACPCQGSGSLVTFQEGKPVLSRLWNKPARGCVWAGRN